MMPSTFMVHATDVSFQLQLCVFANVSCSLAETFRACSSSHLVPSSIIGTARTAAYLDVRIDLMVFCALIADWDEVVE